ncbi:FadR/GntR family transcriptional regulator [Flavitalea antarctica]
MEVSLKALENIETIQLETPVDKIINKLRQLIVTGKLKPGDRLPAERILAERFGVGRGYVREAILKLEFYGLLKTSPQSGTYVAGISLKIMDNIFTDIINFNKEDFSSLIESRYYMEINAARLAAERRTEDDIILMKDALSEYDQKVKRGKNAVDEDILFHMKIASAGGNKVIESLLIILIPDVIKNIVEKKLFKARRGERAVAEHHKILDAIIKQKPEIAAKAMANHLQEAMDKRLLF